MRSSAWPVLVVRDNVGSCLTFFREKISQPFVVEVEDPRNLLVTNEQLRQAAADVARVSDGQVEVSGLKFCPERGVFFRPWTVLPDQYYEPKVVGTDLLSVTFGP